VFARSLQYRRGNSVLRLSEGDVGGWGGLHELPGGIFVVCGVGVCL
jgi:hypothetical protein